MNIDPKIELKERNNQVVTPKKVCVTSSSFSKHPLLIERMCHLFPNVVFNDTGKKFSEDEIIEYLSEAEGAIIGLDSITEKVLANCPHLKIISKYGVGLDNLDIGACQKYNVKIGWTGGVNRLSVAEMTLGFMISLCRNLYSSSLLLKNGQWFKKGGFQLSGKTIGIIGVGYIGKEVIRLLQPFNCKILVNDIIDQEEYYQKVGVISSSKEKIYREADIITIHTPRTSQTQNLFNKSVFEKMKPTAFLINTARGGLINEKDLKEALINGVIAGGAIDAYYKEPPTDLAFLSLKNLYCTPHIGGNAEEAVLAMGRSAIQHLENYFNKK